MPSAASAQTQQTWVRLHYMPWQVPPRMRPKCGGSGSSGGGRKAAAPAAATARRLQWARARRLLLSHTLHRLLQALSGFAPRLPGAELRCLVQCRLREVDTSPEGFQASWSRAGEASPVLNQLSSFEEKRAGPGEGGGGPREVTARGVSGAGRRQNG